MEPISPVTHAPARGVSRALLALAALPALAFTTIACSATVAADGATTSSTAQKLAVVDIRVEQSLVGEGAARVDAAAHFISARGAGAPGDALQLLGLDWKPVPSGRCVLESEGRPEPHALPLRVDLRDLSPVSIELRGAAGGPSAFRLEPRAFPDVMGLVSGVVFVTPADSGAVSGAPRFASVNIAGGAAGELELPLLPQRIRLPEGRSSEGTFPVSAAGVTVDTTPVAAEDRVTIDVVRGGVVRARCGVDREGRARVDGVSLGGAGEGSLVLRVQRRVVRDEASVGRFEARLERNVELKVVAR